MTKAKIIAVVCLVLGFICLAVAEFVAAGAFAVAGGIWWNGD